MLLCVVVYIEDMYTQEEPRIRGEEEGGLARVKGFKPPESIATVPTSSPELDVPKSGISGLMVELRGKTPFELDSRFEERSARLPKTFTTATNQQSADAALFVADIEMGTDPQEARRKLDSLWKRVKAEMERRGITKGFDQAIEDLKVGNAGEFLRTLFGSSGVDNGGGIKRERGGGAEDINAERFFEYISKDRVLVPKHVIGAIREACGDRGMNVGFSEPQLKLAETDGQVLKEVMEEFCRNLEVYPTKFSWAAAQKGLAFWLTYKREAGAGPKDPTFNKDIVKLFEHITDEFDKFYKPPQQEKPAKVVSMTPAPKPVVAAA